MAGNMMIFPEIYLILIAYPCNYSAKKGCLTREVMHPIKDCQRTGMENTLAIIPTQKVEDIAHRKGSQDCEFEKVKSDILPSQKIGATFQEAADLSISKLDS
jgi:hypothetical protein